MSSNSIILVISSFQVTWSQPDFPYFFFILFVTFSLGFLDGSMVKNHKCRRHKFGPGVGKMPWRRKQQPALGILAQENPRKEPGRQIHRVTKEWDMTSMTKQQHFYQKVWQSFEPINKHLLSDKHSTRYSQGCTE